MRHIFFLTVVALLGCGPAHETTSDRKEREYKELCLKDGHSEFRCLEKWMRRYDPAGGLVPAGPQASSSSSGIFPFAAGAAVGALMTRPSVPATPHRSRSYARPARSFGGRRR